MSFEWSGYEAVRIDVASWPPGQPVQSGLVRTDWVIKTLAPLVGDRINLVDSGNLNRLARDMSFEVRIVGPSSLVMTCICPEQMQEPVRLAAASQAWRFVDEQVARLWTVGGHPRAIFPEFMRQRRQLVENLPASTRKTWLWLSLIRSEPLFALMSGRTGNADRLLSMLSGRECDAKLAQFFAGMQIDLAPEATRDNLPKGANVRKLLGQAIEFGLHGVKRDSVDSMAYATERLFDVLYAIDGQVSQGEDDGCAAKEDRAWFTDASQLASSGLLPSGVIERTRSFCRELQSFYSRKEAGVAIDNLG